MTRITAPENIVAPLAKTVTHSFTHHGITVNDSYNWIKDPAYPDVSDKDVLSYLAEENGYFQAVMKPHATLQNNIFDEIKGRIKEDDSSVPWEKGGFIYRWYFEKGAEYRTWCRRASTSDDETTLIDEAHEAKGLDFYRLGDLSISPSGDKMAWSVDNDGSERFTIFVRDLTTNEILSDTISETSGAALWCADNQSFLYVVVSPEWRPYQIKMHRLGTDCSDDILVYEESDTSFFLGVSKSSSEKYFVIRSADHVTAEIWTLPVAEPTAQPKLLSKRQSGRDIYVDHGNGKFYIRTNDSHKDFRIAQVDENNIAPENWQEVKAGGDGHYWRGMQVFKNFILLADRRDGLDQMLVIASDNSEHYIEFPEAAYAANIGTNPEYDQQHIRLNYQSMVTPQSVFDYDPIGRALTLKKEQEIPSGYNKQDYATERLMVKARDGALVPVSLVYKKSFSKNSDAPLHLYAYGAYGLGMDPGFSAARLSLLDRGFAYAIAHIRGGDELGYGWYEDGKLDKRENTFNDFVDVALALNEQGFVKEGNISISGGSAGGELMGAVINQAPDLWSAAVLHVPFVDVLNTMLDDSLPLTPIEWPEWGNPIESKTVFEHMQSYSPYDQIVAKDYPPMLVTGGLNDPRVTYWEPAKWTAKMRATKSDDNLLIMKMNMGAGHAGKSGRYQRIEEVAEEYTFLLMAYGVA